MEYGSTKRHVYEWEDVNLAWLSKQDAIEVDGDKHTVAVYVFDFYRGDK